MIRRPCPFDETEGEIIDLSSALPCNDLLWAKFDPYPVSPGHALVMPRRHVESIFDLSRDEWIAARLALHIVRIEVDERFPSVAGYNIGVNDGRAAGRTTDHVHFHVIPRYAGDVEDPRGGVRNILPGPSPDLWSGREPA